jgi:hypothetical protein
MRMTGETFITFYAPTFRRPQRREACLQSVREQTLVREIQLFGPEDLTGEGIAGMYAAIPSYAPVVKGNYVHVLADDDVLATPTAVAEVKAFAELHGYPGVIVVKVVKRHPQGGLLLPLDQSGPPFMGKIDLGCLIVRQDIWKAHCHQYGHCYEGDAVFAEALHAAGNRFVYADVFFLDGAVMRGQPEGA